MKLTQEQLKALGQAIWYKVGFIMHEGVLAECLATIPDPAPTPSSSAQLRPIAEMPEKVPEGCVRYYFHRYPSGYLSNGVSIADADSTHVIDIHLPEPEDTERREFEEAMIENGICSDFRRREDGVYRVAETCVAWDTWQVVRKTKA